MVSCKVLLALMAVVVAVSATELRREKKQVLAYSAGYPVASAYPYAAAAYPYSAAAYPYSAYSYSAAAYPYSAAAYPYSAYPYSAYGRYYY
ncbi:nematocyst expressed protein 4-like [Macrosteles quadrilineatus]|uniref:nematocyst expressed protein 4-like n=1 Tax=Macrosteles quadrilineatus TaxID=74068 RepID=UPI0023E2A1A1|nr:nematocyst expressed protein 4-like [Macrosteles quadrilineatus]